MVCVWDRYSYSHWASSPQRCVAFGRSHFHHFLQKTPDLSRVPMEKSGSVIWGFFRFQYITSAFVTMKSCTDFSFTLNSPFLRPSQILSPYPELMPSSKEVYFQQYILPRKGWGKLSKYKNYANLNILGIPNKLVRSR